MKPKLAVEHLLRGNARNQVAAMDEDSRPMFPHRHNPDGTIDSICTRCFATIATERIEILLQKAEEDHTCTHLNLSQISYPPHG